MEKKMYFVLYEKLGEREMSEISDTEWEEMSEFSYTIEEFAKEFNNHNKYTYWKFPNKENYVCRVI